VHIFSHKNTRRCFFFGKKTLLVHLVGEKSPDGKSVREKKHDCASLWTVLLMQKIILTVHLCGGKKPDGASFRGKTPDGASFKKTSPDGVSKKSFRGIHVSKKRETPPVWRWKHCEFQH